MENKRQRFSPEFRERAVRLVLDHGQEHGSRWAAIRSIAEKMGCSAEALRNWVQRAEVDAGARPGLTTDDRQRLKELERENLEEALHRFGTPEIFNTDQGSQFTSAEFLNVLRRRQIAISMDGTGCWRDNVFVERLWLREVRRGLPPRVRDRLRRPHRLDALLPVL